MIIKLSVPNRFKLKKRVTLKTVIMQNHGEIHYIGGADVLPAPLSPEEEAEALECLGTEGEKNARSRLIEHNLRLVVYIASLIFLSGLKVLIALISPMVPMEIKSSTPTLVLSNFLAM